MISVEEAVRRMEEAFIPLPAEDVALGDAPGRVLAAPVAALVSHPPADMSAMDGYAVRAEDVARCPTVLEVIGEAPAGRAFAGRVGPGEAVRIFTGGPMPPGADAVVIQENTDTETSDGDGTRPPAASGAPDGRRRVRVDAPSPRGKHIRRAGQDFARGDTLAEAGQTVTARLLGLIAGGNVTRVAVTRRPRIALLTTGNELVPAGSAPGALGPAGIVNANSHALGALIRAAGGEAIDLGIARDDIAEIQARVRAAQGADLLVTTGGASVGEHDLVQAALGPLGFDVAFWKVAMRPGKPSMFGRISGLPAPLAVLGLPGNPVSAFVSAVLYLRPILRRLTGAREPVNRPLAAALGRDLPANDRRQDYLRAALETGADGTPVATPFDRQGSSMMRLLAEAGCLIVRPPLAPAAARGDRVPVIPLGGLGGGI